MMTLTYNLTTVAIRQPELGDTTIFDGPRKRLTSVDGTLSVVRSAQATMVTYEFTSLGLCDSDVAGLVTFFDDSAGHPVEITTYEGTFTGYIINPEIEMIEGLDNRNQVSLTVLYKFDEDGVRGTSAGTAVGTSAGEYIWLRLT